MKRLLLIFGISLFTACQKEAKETQKTPTPPVATPTDFIEELWYKNSFIYNLDVEVFKDSDGDGVGDFKGLTQQLDYLKGLGVDAIWLAPFQPTPSQDDGYDVADFYGIDRRLGTNSDFDEFMRAANQRGIRVMMDMVINHTSNQHPWFQEARRNKNSRYRSWYVWSKERPEKWDTGMVFPGVQKAVWTYDSVASEYYYHRFYEFQPDLNAQNPEVQQEFRKIIKHWLDKGIAGFRLDAVPFLIEVAHSDFDPDHPQHQYDMISLLRQYIQWHKKDAIMLGEANVDPKEQEPYFGKDGQGIQTMFNFFANQYLFYGLASGEVEPLVKALNDTKQIPFNAQWAFFLRNHDEIDLDRLSDQERAKAYAKFGPDTNMQLYNRGIRRRLAPMLGDLRQIEMAYSLLFSLPGTPVIRYGEEIGMGDDLTLKERLSVRTPMQWSNQPNAGFSTTGNTVRPVITKGMYGYPQRNVAAQLSDSASLLNRIKQFSKLRKSCPEIGWGKWTVLNTNSTNLLAIRYDWEGRSLVMVHNFSSEPQQFQLTTGLKQATTLVSLFDQAKTNAEANGTNALQLPGYGYNWYRLTK
ncbi:alpha-amylase family protein [Tellurirhabdus bombi]|uniref:alpha-amylase family protein n=1 Tax=Tellurirhabdus bombi TaxID=2907205 RepID=UPI001F2492FA|nr:alpha-amylase family protein [Tellurirhabdus bombi]